MNKGTPVLRTRHLVLRRPGPDDLPSYTAFMTSPRSRFIGEPVSEATAFRRYAMILGHWQLRGGGPFALELNETGESIGLVGWHQPPDWPGPELMWQIWSDRHEGKGWAAEAAVAARAYMRNAWGLGNLISLIAKGNVRSEGLALRLGAYRGARFRAEGGSEACIWRHPLAEEPGGVLSRRAA